MNPRLLLAFPIAVIAAVLAEQALVCAATMPNERSHPAPEVPKQILTGARNLLASRVGREFFQKYLALDQRGCACWSIGDSVAGVPPERFSTPPRVSRWRLQYNLMVLKKPWVHGIVTVFLDSAGALLGPVPVDGVSDCIGHPEERTFSITEANARRIAKSAGLSTGIAPWKVAFQWDPLASVPCYVWRVWNTLTTDSTGFRGHFDTILISASTGRVLRKERY